MNAGSRLTKTRDDEWAPARTSDDTRVEPPAGTGDREPGPRWAADRDALLRIRGFSVLAPMGGWLAAWGAAVLAIACLAEAGVAVGLGFGIADGDVNLDSGFWAGLWTLVVQAGAFVLGGYVAGRMARARSLLHATLAWLAAVLATAADAVVTASRSGGQSVLGALGLPHWSGLGYEGRVAIPLVIFALGALVGALIGGALAAGANRRDTVPSVEIARRHRGEAPWVSRPVSRPRPPEGDPARQASAEPGHGRP